MEEIAPGGLPHSAAAGIQAYRLVPTLAWGGGALRPSAVVLLHTTFSCVLVALVSSTPLVPFFPTSPKVALFSPSPGYLFLAQD